MEEDISKYEPLLNFPILHGRYVCDKVLSNFKTEQVSISEDLHVVTVIDRPHLYQRTVEAIKEANVDIHVVELEHYTKWISKIEGLRDYIQENYETLPDYILYVDGFDVIIQKDILNPKEYLDFYGCKVLFNAEPAYHHTGVPDPIPNYFDPLYYEHKDKYIELNNEKYKSPFQICLNAGVFLGEKEYLLELLKEAYDLMADDVNKGFPYGCPDDQCLLRYLNNKHFDKISVDVFYKLAFWGCSQLFDYPGEVYSMEYAQKFLETYLKEKDGQ